MARFDQGFVRRNGKVWYRRGGKVLCEVCGVHDTCELRSALVNLGAWRLATVAVEECGIYVPVLGFQDRSGLEGSFNTFRRGRGWANRLELGCRVALHDLAADRLLGRATVTGIHYGPLGGLLRDFAADNHLMRGLSAIEAPGRLHAVLRRLYGTNYAGVDCEFSVIELACGEEGDADRAA
jgi:hypothetical protein